MDATGHRIDDQDKSVDYSEPLLGVGEKGWSTNGGPKEYMNTASLSHKKGASAKLTFTGSSVTVYGIVSPSSRDLGTTSQYSIDGSSSGTYTTKPVKDAQYDVKFFQSGTLKAGQHTLEVVNETEDGWLWLDYFVVSDGATNSTSTTSATASSTSSTSTMSSTSSTSSPAVLPSTTSSSSMSTVYVGAPVPSVTASSDVSAATSDSQHETPSAGPVLGAICGGIFGIMFLFIIIWFVRRKLADRFADEAAAIPTFAANPPPNAHKLALSFSCASSPNPNMIQDHSRNQSNGPVWESKIHAPRLPPAAVPQLQPRSRPTSHVSRPVVTPDIGPTQSDVFCGGNQRQSSYIPPPAYPGPPGLNPKMGSEK